METRSKNFLLANDLKWENPAPGITRQIMGYDEKMMMVKVVFGQDSIGAAHRHPHVQTTYVVNGRFEVMIEGEKKVLCAGDGFYIEPDAEHGVICLEAGTLIDVFAPMREDFL